jgi:hypothetical protein
MQPRPKRIARLIMVPFDARESVSLAMAARLSGKSANTIRLWAERYGVGRKIGGDWHISRVALRMFLDGNTAALAAYHAGDLPNPLVRSYFEQAGLQMLISAEVSNVLCVHSDGRGRQLQKNANSANPTKQIWRTKASCGRHRSTICNDCRLRNTQ